ncbi:hypothetical protein CALVIDRAFT_244128 [Calocera viscosa TUFC12733]|uniref:Uncharacterized protein n=1 Tax=Calocera viscosa (strain TUFC12733) TaxID=1330018 RepID=A0A167JRH9_CALVF|nr:hypothetical protein CALVIDRAFT_244128 [Calocera viscosa TUFC12733]
MPGSPPSPAQSSLPPLPSFAGGPSAPASTIHASSTPAASLAQLLSTSYTELEALRTQLSHEKRRADRAEKLYAQCTEPDRAVAARRLADMEARAERAERARHEIEHRVSLMRQGWHELEKYLAMLEVRSADARAAFARTFTDIILDDAHGGANGHGRPGSPSKPVPASSLLGASPGGSSFGDLIADPRRTALPFPAAPPAHMYAHHAHAQTIPLVRRRQDSFGSSLSHPFKRPRDERYAQSARSSGSGGSVHMQPNTTVPQLTRGLANAIPLTSGPAQFHSGPPPSPSTALAPASSSTAVTAVSKPAFVLASPALGPKEAKEMPKERTAARDADMEVDGEIVTLSQRTARRPDAPAHAVPRSRTHSISDHRMSHISESEDEIESVRADDGELDRDGEAGKERDGDADADELMDSEDDLDEMILAAADPGRRSRSHSHGHKKHRSSQPSHSGPATPHGEYAERPVVKVNAGAAPPGTLNERGERCCLHCKLPGKYKDGKCVEKWGPGPMGPGTVCDRCRKKIRRTEKRDGAGSQPSSQSQSQSQPLPSSQSQNLSASQPSALSSHSHSASSTLASVDYSQQSQDSLSLSHPRDRERDRDLYSNELSSQPSGTNQNQKTTVSMSSAGAGLPLRRVPSDVAPGSFPSLPPAPQSSTITRTPVSDMRSSAQDSRLLSLPSNGYQGPGTSYTSSSSSGSSAVRELMAEKHLPPPEIRAFGQPWMQSRAHYPAQVRAEPPPHGKEQRGQTIKQEHVGVELL